MNILVIEDNQSLSEAICVVLKENKFLPSTVSNGSEALAKLINFQFAAIVLDLGLPDIDGLELCKQIRQKAINTPILILTARIDLASKVEGLDNGADDYLCKPFLMQEFLARIRALTRREVADKSAEIQIGENITINTNKAAVYRNGEKLDLTPTESRLILYLTTKRGTVVSAIEIYNNVWGEDVDKLYFSDALKVNIARLRKKIGNEVIKTVPGFGYLID